MSYLKLPRGEKALIAVLETANRDDARSAVRQLVMSIGARGLLAYGMQARLKLVEALGKVYPDHIMEDKLAIAICKALPGDGAYAKWRDGKLTEYADRLAADAAIAAAASSWTGLPADEKIGILQRMADIHAGVFATAPVSVAAYEEVPALKSLDHRTVHSGYTPEDKAIFVNMANDAKCASFAGALEALTCEAMRHLQHELMAGDAAGRYAENDPRHIRARALTLTRQLHIVPRYEQDWAQYICHPMEVEARGQARELARRFRPAAPSLGQSLKLLVSRARPPAAPKVPSPG